ncbi:autotransporter outer membrane beta-barrel domain-containing protein, partial [Brucella sp. 21LCYQ03]|nr:autotransporter outer membrane beta-barrel domain-containing protein [Brucella sp. 21LCYQ03]
ITGTPTTAFDGTVTIKVTDAQSKEASHDFTLRVDPADLSVTTSVLKAGKVGEDYGQTQTLSASGGVAPYTWSASGLPDGLRVEGNLITGTPTTAFDGTVTIKVTDAQSKEASHDFTLRVDPADLSVTTSVLKAGKVGEDYGQTQTLSASGGVAPYTWSASGLPDGLRVEGNLITGTPTTAFDGTVTIKVTDAQSKEASHDFTLRVDPADLPEAQSFTLNVQAGKTASIDLTTGAVRGPFTDANIVDAPDSDVGHAQINRKGSAFILSFTASVFYSGKSELKYTLSNAYGVSKPAVVVLNVIARPDPSKDPEVIGLINAQAQTAVRLGTGQMANFQRRLEYLHDEGECRQSSINLSLEGSNGQVRLGSGAIADSNAATGSANGCGTFQQKLAMWTDGQINFGRTDNDDLEQKYTSTAVSGGVDYRFSPSFVGGVGFGYGRDTTDIGAHNTQNKGRLFALSAYSSYHTRNGLFLDTLMGFGWLNFDSDRYVSATGGRAFGTRKGTQLYGSVAVGYQYRNERWSLSPYLRTDIMQTTMDRFSEMGADDFNLTYGAQKLKSLSVTIGASFNYKIPFEKFVLTPRTRLEFTHDFSGSNQARIGYVDMGGILPYSVDIDPMKSDRLALEAGLDVATYNNWTLGMSYGTRFSPDAKSMQHGFRWKVSKRFD